MGIIETSRKHYNLYVERLDDQQTVRDVGWDASNGNPNNPCCLTWNDTGVCLADNSGESVVDHRDHARD